MLLPPPAWWGRRCKVGDLHTESSPSLGTLKIQSSPQLLPCPCAGRYMRALPLRGLSKKNLSNDVFFFVLLLNLFPSLSYCSGLGLSASLLDCVNLQARVTVRTLVNPCLFHCCNLSFFRILSHQGDLNGRDVCFHLLPCRSSHWGRKFEIDQCSQD